MTREIPGPFDPAEIRRFLDCFLYREAGFLVDQVLGMDADTRSMQARLDTNRELPLSSCQRVSEHHPAHVAAGDMLQATGSLGCLHAWFFHGCRWDEGWAGFGNRIHRADFKKLVEIGPPMLLHSRETRTRVGERRVVIRFEFEFFQSDALVYYGDQTAMFTRS